LFVAVTSSRDGDQVKGAAIKKCGQAQSKIEITAIYNLNRDFGRTNPIRSLLGVGDCAPSSKGRWFRRHDKHVWGTAIKTCNWRSVVASFTIICSKTAIRGER
jgi:hypothetical protein